MTSITKTHLLLNNISTNDEINKKTSELAIKLEGTVAYPSRIFQVKDEKIPCASVEDRITHRSLSRGLSFRPTKPLAVISGAGIAGLAASFELRAKGFNIVIVEKRKDFSRLNIINLSVETQAFLKKFNLLERFEKYVAARIDEHRYVFMERDKSTSRLSLSDVREVKIDESVCFEPKNFSKLFDQDGIYSVQIGLLQTFLAENALEAGVNIYGDVTVEILARRQEGGISKVQITADQILKPNLFFIAEGAQPTTTQKLGITSKSVANACTGENWIFGNMTYSGKETFVVSLIDASEKTMRMANVIFNAKSQAINVAVTSEREVPEDTIRGQIIETARQVFCQKAFPLEEMDSVLLATVSKPVHINNQISTPFSMDNVFCIGDSSGSSSPLAGLGGTLGLTLVPLTVRQLINDYQKQSVNIHKNFNEFSEGYTARWIQKSEGIKKFCIRIFEKERSKDCRGLNGN